MVLGSINLFRDRVNEALNHVLRASPAGASPIAISRKPQRMRVRDPFNVHIGSAFGVRSKKKFGERRSSSSVAAKR